MCCQCNRELGGPSVKTQASASSGNDGEPTGSTSSSLTLLVADKTLNEKKDEGRRIWAGKCGHVYCGVCAVEKRKTKARKREGKCIVCGQAVSGPRGMFEIFV